MFIRQPNHSYDIGCRACTLLEIRSPDPQYSASWSIEIAIQHNCLFQRETYLKQFKMLLSKDWRPDKRQQFQLTSKNLSLTSLMMTSWPASRPAVAMPLPMRPPPMTATLCTLRGFSPASVTPVTFFVDLCAKKMCTRALWVSSAAA